MKLILLLLAAVALPTTLFGQGQIYFANDSSTRFNTNDTRGHIGPMTGLNAFRIGLYTAPAGTQNQSLFTLLAVATNSANPVAAGLFSYPESPFTIQGNNGTPIAVQIRAWSLFAGSSYETALAGGSYPMGQPVFIGRTDVGTIIPAVGGAPPPSLFGATGVFTSGIVLIAPLPEPSTYVLAALGALMLFRFRQRRTTK